MSVLHVDLIQYHIGTGFFISCDSSVIKRASWNKRELQLFKIHSVSSECFIKTRCCLDSPMPLVCSDMSFARKEEELEELLDWKDLDEGRDVSLLTDDFFVVFCVAVRLHSVNRNIELV